MKSYKIVKNKMGTLPANVALDVGAITDLSRSDLLGEGHRETGLGYYRRDSNF